MIYLVHLLNCEDAFMYNDMHCLQNLGYFLSSEDAIRSVENQLFLTKMQCEYFTHVCITGYDLGFNGKTSHLKYYKIDKKTKLLDPCENPFSNPLI